MLSDQEKRDLAVLRGRAYGRGDAIDGAELARLRELEAHAVDRSQEEAADVRAVEPGTAASERDEADTADLAAYRAAGAGPRQPTRSRRRVLLPIAAGIVGIALGAGVTAAVSQPAPTVVTTSGDTRLSPSATEQLPGVAELGRWDAGSLAVLGGLDATTIWSATREGGEETCVIVYSAAEQQGLTVTCADTATVTEDGVSGVVSIYEDDGSSAVFGFQANPSLDPGVVFRRQ
jgi:hypothetical protein